MKIRDGAEAQPARDARQRLMSLTRWDNEGGAGPAGSPPVGASRDEDDLAQLRIRIIALENLVIALLADASNRQLESVLAMADYITPRPGHTPHRLTVRASRQMIDLVNRSGRFRHEP